MSEDQEPGYIKAAREQKSKKLARAILRETIAFLREDADGMEMMWSQLAAREKVKFPSELTRKRVVEILEGIAI